METKRPGILRSCLRSTSNVMSDDNLAEPSPTFLSSSCSDSSSSSDEMMIEEVDDALIEMKNNIDSLKNFLSVTNNLSTSAKKRVRDLEDQKIIATNEIVYWKRHLIIPAQRQLSFTGMVDFYNKQVAACNAEVNSTEKKINNLERVLNNIDMDLYLAKAEENKYKESVMKLENDINALEYCFEEEKADKKTILSYFEQERDNYNKMIDAPGESDAKLQDLQTRLNSTLAMSCAIVKKHEQEYERKMSSLQEQLDETQQKLENCQHELSDVLDKSQAVVAKSKEAEGEGEKLGTYENQIAAFKKQKEDLDAAAGKHDKEVAEKVKEQESILTSLRKELVEIESRQNNPEGKDERKVLQESHLDCLKKDLFFKEEKIKENQDKILSMQKKSQDLQNELHSQEISTEKKLTKLRSQMRKKVITAELDAAEKLKLVNDKMLAMAHATKDALNKKDEVLSVIYEDCKDIDLKMRENEHAFGVKLEELKKKMTDRLLKAEQDANSALEDATRQLEIMQQEKDTTLSDQEITIKKLQKNVPEKYREKIIGEVLVPHKLNRSSSCKI